MDHIRMDLGKRESQISEAGELIEKRMRIDGEQP